jgi:hypothetical protein
MRQPIETAPRDGKTVILEDDASAAYDTAHWSRKTYQWVGENGEPSKITPTHWYPMPRDKYLLREDDRSPRRFAAWWSITATLVATAIIGVYFRAEVAGYVTQYAGLQDIFGISRLQVVEQGTLLPGRDSRKAELVAVQHVEADQVGAQAGAQVKQTDTVPGPEARQSLEQEQSTDNLAKELAETRRTVDRLTLQLRAETANSAQSLGQERERTAALAQEADTVRRELTASAAQYRQTVDEERARSAALASELATAKREIETQAAQSRGANDETERLKQTAERTAAELLQSLEQERDRATTIARDHDSAGRTSGVRVTPEPAANSPAVEVAPTARPAAVEAQAQGSPDAIRLIARASALLGQGNIGAARVVLERAAETGSAQASFMLAETYDPAILSGWGAYGTRGEVTKARELYAKARAGGIQEAKDRFNALRQ